MQLVDCLLMAMLRLQVNKHINVSVTTYSDDAAYRRGKRSGDSKINVATICKKTAVWT